MPWAQRTPRRETLCVYFGSSWKHLNRNHDILELIEAGREYMLSGSQRISGGCQVHIQVKNKIKKFKKWNSWKMADESELWMSRNRKGCLIPGDRTWLGWGCFSPILSFLKTLPGVWHKKAANSILKKIEARNICACPQASEIPSLGLKELDCQMGGYLAASL